MKSFKNIIKSIFIGTLLFGMFSTAQAWTEKRYALVNDDLAVELTTTCRYGYYFVTGGFGFRKVSVDTPRPETTFFIRMWAEKSYYNNPLNPTDFEPVNWESGYVTKEAFTQKRTYFKPIASVIGAPTRRGDHVENEPFYYQVRGISETSSYANGVFKYHGGTDGPYCRM